MHTVIEDVGPGVGTVHRGPTGPRHARVPVPGSVVTFGMCDFHLGHPRFIGVGVVAGDARPHATLGTPGLPLRSLTGEPTPDWVALHEVIDIVPPTH